MGVKHAGLLPLLLSQRGPRVPLSKPMPVPRAGTSYFSVTYELIFNNSEETIKYKTLCKIQTHYFHVKIFFPQVYSAEYLN